MSLDAEFGGERMNLTLALVFGKRNKTFCTTTSQSVGWPMGKNSMIFGVSRDPGFHFLSLLIFEKKT
jgi:hypothetical protein